MFVWVISLDVNIKRSAGSSRQPHRVKTKQSLTDSRYGWDGIGGTPFFCPSEETGGLFIFCNPVDTDSGHDRVHANGLCPAHRKEGIELMRTILTLFVFITLLSVADAATYYRCVDRNGNVIMTDNPPHDATCDERGAERDKTPMERQQADANQKVDKQILEIDKQIAALTMPTTQERSEFISGGRPGTGYVRKWTEIVSSERNAVRNAKKITDLLILKADIISKAPRLDTEMRNPRDVGLKMMNQNADMEDKIKRQKRDMEDKKNEMEDKIRRQKAEIQHQKNEIQRLERDKRKSEHNQRMQQLQKDMGQ